MNIPISGDAPEWAQVFANAVGTAFEEALTRPIPFFTVATLPPATDKRWQQRLVLVSDGTNGLVVLCTGAAWIYMDGVPV